MLPFWLRIALKTTLTLALPWLEKNLPTQVVAVIEMLLSILSNSQNQPGTVQALADHLNGFKDPHGQRV